jgi:hypothetical protein
MSSVMLLIQAYRCKLQADRGRSIGWSPKDPPEHILEAADEEVELILSKL